MVDSIHTHDRLGEVFVFTYGSLLSSRSLRATLPGLEPSDCRPAVLRGHVRTLGVAFPNDGSQPDKLYSQRSGARPPIVLFANLESAGASVAANGVLVPVGAEQLERIGQRERRYDMVDVTPDVRAGPGMAREFEPGGSFRVVAFVGARRFTRPEEIRRGVVSRDYWSEIVVGATEWERRSAGFLSAFWASTRPPAPETIVDLQRVDLPG